MALLVGALLALVAGLLAKGLPGWIVIVPSIQPWPLSSPPTTRSSPSWAPNACTRSRVVSRRSVTAAGYLAWLLVTGRTRVAVYYGLPTATNAIARRC